ncbi:unnamed protein product, partial [Cuscuta epithymum]
MEKKRRESLIKMKPIPGTEGEPSTANDLSLAMMNLIREWRDSQFEETVLEVIPNSPDPTPSPPKSPSPKPVTPTTTPPPSPPQPQQIPSPTPKKSSTPKQPSPCHQITPIRSRSPSPPPPSHHQRTPIPQTSPHQSPNHQKSKSPSPQQKPTSNCPSPQHSAASAQKREPVVRILSSTEDNDGFLTASMAGDLQSAKRKTPTPPLSPAQPQPQVNQVPQPEPPKAVLIPFQEFVESAEDFGDQMVAGLNKLLVLNQKHDAHLDLVQYNIESGLEKIANALSQLSTTFFSYMKTSNEKVDDIASEVASLHTVLFSQSQTLSAQDKAIQDLSDAVDDLQWSSDKHAEQLTDVEDICKTLKEFDIKLINSGKDRDHKLTLLEATTKDIQSAVGKQKELIEGLASVTQTLPGTLEAIKENNATEFSKIG